jgi:hypothetical protein
VLKEMLMLLTPSINSMVELIFNSRDQRMVRNNRF